MARKRISLVDENTRKHLTWEQKIRSGVVNPDNFHELSPDDQQKVNHVLFEMASREINPNQGSSTIEFVLFSFMRIMSKRVEGRSLNSQDLRIKASLDRIMEMHEITNTKMPIEKWLFDYMRYAEMKASSILQNRKDHIDRKKKVTGSV